MDLADAKRKIVFFIQRYFAAAGKRAAIVGVSGGLDSAVALFLSAQAIGSRNVIAVALPSSATPQRDLKDARLLAKRLKVKLIEMDIEPIVEAFGQLAMPKLSRANIAARVRMAILYSLAQRHNGLVVGTGDKSELMLGYFTKYGDGAADLFPLGGLYKTEVRALARMIGVPKGILQKPPSPALWKGQTAEGELGFSYQEADGVLKAIEKGEKKSEVERKFGKRLVRAILIRMEKNRHKLLPAPVCQL
ncbi:MAG: NAD+ synthase [Candidatus Micrarchaeota archaeon]|nr:NAD+ synthase [Candidatus Micrarchaeota archaeon]